MQVKMKSCHDQDVAPVLAFAREVNRIEVSEAAQRFSYLTNYKLISVRLLEKENPKFL